MYEWREVPMFKERILVADDDPTTQAIVAYLLGREGFKVARASTAEAARSWVTGSNGSPCLAVVDWGLPASRGGAFALWLHERSPRTRVLFTTIGRSAEVTGHGLPAEAVEVLSKPFRPEELGRKVASLLLRSPRRTALQTAGAGSGVTSS